MRTLVQRAFLRSRRSDGPSWSCHPGVVMQDDTNADALDYHEMKPIVNTLGFIDDLMDQLVGLPEYRLGRDDPVG